MLLVCVLLIGGCAATPPQSVSFSPVTAQFGLRFAYGDMAVPLQGAVSVAEHEGSLGVIFPHGRTLGVCLYRQGGMECSPASSAGEAGFAARFMLERIGLAVYRLLPALARAPGEDVAREDVAEADWSVHWKEADTGRIAEYRDLDRRVTLDLRFTEIAKP
jgi:hypothetical protein